MHVSIDQAGGLFEPPGAGRTDRLALLRQHYRRQHIVTAGPDRWRLVTEHELARPPDRHPIHLHGPADMHALQRELLAMTARALVLQDERDAWVLRCHGAWRVALRHADAADAATDDAEALTRGFAWLWWVMVAQVVLSVLVLSWQGARALGWMG